MDETYSIPRQMYELFNYRDDLTVKKKFDYVLDFLAYIAKVEMVSTPSAPEDIFNQIVLLGEQYLKAPLNFDLPDLYYSLKIGVYARPKLKQKNVVSKFVRCLQKPLILAQHNNIRAGDALLYVKQFYPEKEIIHFGYSHSITEYHIVLILCKLFNINAYILCVDKKGLDKTKSPDIFNLNHMYINKWKKPSKKEIHI